MSSPKVAIIIYTMYGHIATLAESIKIGLQSAGGTTAIYQIAETLPQEILMKLHAPPKPAYPIITPEELLLFDAFLFGIPTHYGNMPAQWRHFWDATGGLWAKGALSGKTAGMFFSTGVLGGGQETTAISSISTLVHHGLTYVPLGYGTAFAQLTDVTEVHGGACVSWSPSAWLTSAGYRGSPWGSGTFAGSDGLRQPSVLELEIARIQGKSFWQHLTRNTQHAVELVQNFDGLQILLM
ncbi:NADH-quinone oxidoreductase [Artomyces pyxidatus]|uniref:NADH-quinone oxidoreductase n=1 Tax=Artomyces pyxidatus TaxID=48021 RepID=A0ACB8SLC3_9AGAM|nr:NADH-quinone oxidoreductase [Artomyces pyxidatus]